MSVQRERGYPWSGLCLGEVVPLWGSPTPRQDLVGQDFFKQDLARTGFFQTGPGPDRDTPLLPPPNRTTLQVVRLLRSHRRSLLFLRFTSVSSEGDTLKLMHSNVIFKNQPNYERQMYLLSGNLGLLRVHLLEHYIGDITKTFTEHGP